MKTPIIILTLIQFVLGISSFGQTGTSDSKEKDQILREFMYCDRNKYKDITSQVDVVQTSNFVYYQTDSLRIYISPQFFLGFSTYEDSVSRNIYDIYQNMYGSIFEQGLLTAKIFYRELGIEFNDTSLGEDSLSSDNYDLFGFKGSVVKILHIEHLEWLDEKKVRRFEIWATTSKIKSGWGGFPVFYLELTNKEADNKTALKDFIEGSKTTCFKLGHFQ